MSYEISRTLIEAIFARNSVVLSKSVFLFGRTTERKFINAALLGMSNTSICSPVRYFAYHMIAKCYRCVRSNRNHEKKSNVFIINSSHI